MAAIVFNANHWLLWIYGNNAAILRAMNRLQFSAERRHFGSRGVTRIEKLNPCGREASFLAWPSTVE